MISRHAGHAIVFVEETSLLRSEWSLWNNRDLLLRGSRLVGDARGSRKQPNVKHQRARATASRVNGAITLRALSRNSPVSY